MLSFCARYRGGADSVVWRLRPDGLLKMDAVLLNRASGGGGFDDAFTDNAILNFGFTFSYPESECTGMRWLGRGPYRVWKNRIPGTNYGIWQKDFNNTVTGESADKLVYPEFKGYHANLYWATIQGKQNAFTVYAATDGVFFRVFTPDEPRGRQDGIRTMPDFPAGDLSFLLDIPAIRSFKPISQHGPQSQPGTIRIKKGDEGLNWSWHLTFCDSLGSVCPIIISLSISAKPDRIGLRKCVIFASFTTMRYITYTKNTMKKLFYSLLAVVLAACGSEKQAPIDREALVARNNPQVSSFDSLASLSVGNGEFAFYCGCYRSTDFSFSI